MAQIDPVLAESLEAMSLSREGGPAAEVIPAIGSASPRWLTVIFFVSGFAALLYQVLWQRVLFASFGVNVEAVTVVVTAFLAGLGCGSLLGGKLSNADMRGLLYRFAAIELTVGMFGIFSLSFFRWIGVMTLDLTSLERGVISALVVMVPTTLMGATLPILVEYLVQRTGNVGRSVAALYFVNTAGSALAAFAAVLLLLRSLGELRSTLLAASLNLLAGAYALRRARSGGSMP